MEKKNMPCDVHARVLGKKKKLCVMLGTVMPNTKCHTITSLVQKIVYRGKNVLTVP